MEKLRIIAQLKGLALAGLALSPLASIAQSYQIVERPRQECWYEQTHVQSNGYQGLQFGAGQGQRPVPSGYPVGANQQTPFSASPFQSVQHCRTIVERVRVPVQGGRAASQGRIDTRTYQTWTTEDHAQPTASDDTNSLRTGGTPVEQPWRHQGHVQGRDD